MKYRYVAVYQIRGLIHNPEMDNVEIPIKQKETSIKVILTANPDIYCFELDRAQSISYLMLKSLVGQRDSSDIKVGVETEVGRIRERRKKELESSEVLVFIAEGETQANFSHNFIEKEDYGLDFEIVDKKRIAEVHNNQVNAVIASLCFLIEPESIQIKRMQSGIYLINDSGKPIYSLGFSGSVEHYSSRRTTEEVIKEVQNQTSKLIDDPSLSRVYKFLVQAILKDNDELRRFLFGWTALEMLVNKVFSEYEKLYVQNLLGAEPPIHKQKYFERIRNVMKGKYSIVDKFTIFAAYVGDDSSESDIEDFVKIKDIRDNLVHVELIDEKSLPISKTVKLLNKYLRHHIKAKAT